jgi:predicted choloylglycine hydrolase
MDSKLGFTTTPVSLLLALAGRFLAWRTQGELDYLADMESWAEWVVGDFDQVLLSNFSYELHQTMGGLGLCTSVAFLRHGLGMVHCRNLDWPLPQLRAATIVLECKSAAGPFKAVSVPGMIGVLSAVAKSRFSITINSKEDRNRYLPNPAGWGATLLLRWILESCADWDEALRELKKAPAFVPFYVTLVGCKPGQAVVVEVNMSGKNRVYRQSDYPVAVANHYPGEICEDEEMDSQERQELVERQALSCKAKSLRGCFAVVSRFPVLHAGTVQSMVLHPRSGSVLVQKT